MQGSRSQCAQSELVSAHSRNVRLHPSPFVPHKVSLPKIISFESTTRNMIPYYLSLMIQTPKLCNLAGVLHEKTESSDLGCTAISGEQPTQLSCIIPRRPELARHFYVSHSAFTQVFTCYREPSGVWKIHFFLRGSRTAQRQMSGQAQAATPPQVAQMGKSWPWSLQRLQTMSRWSAAYFSVQAYTSNHM